jgi:hypothetical protein
MADVQWYTIIIPIVGGGAMGALISAGVSAYRNRIQPIGQEIEFVPIFRGTLGTSSLRTQVTVCEDSQEIKFDNLHIGQVKLINRGSNDYDEFELGITLSNGDLAIYVEPQTPDRLHKAECSTPVTPAEPKSELDFVLKPFNRGNTYTLQVFIVTTSEKERPEKIELSSTEAIRFVTMPTLTEQLAQATRFISVVRLGPFEIRFSV